MASDSVAISAHAKGMPTCAVIPPTRFSIVWLKPVTLAYYPSHKWDGNDEKYCFETFIAVGFNQRITANQNRGFSRNGKLIAEDVNRLCKSQSLIKFEKRKQ